MAGIWQFCHLLWTMLRLGRGGVVTKSVYLFDDNPATQDLAGLRAVAVADVAMDDRFETLTVGLNSPWGGGKNTAPNLIASRCVVHHKLVHRHSRDATTGHAQRRRLEAGHHRAPEGQQSGEQV